MENIYSLINTEDDEFFLLHKFCNHQKDEMAIAKGYMFLCNMKVMEMLRK